MAIEDNMQPFDFADFDQPDPAEPDPVTPDLNPVSQDPKKPPVEVDFGAQDAERLRQKYLQAFDNALKNDASRELIGEAQQIGKSIGLDPDAALRDIEVARRIMERRVVERDQLLEKHPHLAKHLSDSVDFAKISADRIQSLAKIEDKLSFWDLFKFTGMPFEKVRAEFNQPNYFSKSWEQSKVLDDLHLQEVSIANAIKNQGYVTETDVKNLNRIKAQMETMSGDSTSLGMAMHSARFLAPKALISGIVASAATVGSAVVSLGASIPASPVIWKGSFSASMAWQLQSAYAAEDMAEMLRRGVALDDARWFSAMSGAIQAGLDVAAPVAGGQIRREITQGIGKEAMKRAVAEMMVPMTSGRAWWQYGKTVLKDTALETVQEISQDVTKTFFVNLADTKTELTREQLIDQLTETIKSSAMVSAWMTPWQPSIGLFRDLKRASRSARGSELVQALSSSSAEELVRKRNPELYASWLNSLSTENGAEQVFFKTEELLNAFDRTVDEAVAAADMGPVATETARAAAADEILNSLRKHAPEVAQVVEEARSKGTVSTQNDHVSVPTGTYFTYLDGTSFGAQLRNHAKFSVADMSLAQRIEVTKQRAQMVEDAKKALKRRKAEGDVWEKEADEIYNSTLQNLRARNLLKNDEQRQNAATILKSMVVTMAEEETNEGRPTTPKQIFEKIPLFSKMQIVSTAEQAVAQPSELAAGRLLFDKSYGTTNEVVVDYADEEFHGDPYLTKATQQVIDERFGKGTFKAMSDTGEPVANDSPELATEVAMQIQNKADELRMADGFLPEAQELSPEAQRELQAATLPPNDQNLDSMQPEDAGVDAEDDVELEAGETIVDHDRRKNAGPLVSPPNVKLDEQQRKEATKLFKQKKVGELLKELPDDEILCLIYTASTGKVRERSIGDRFQLLKQVLDEMPTAAEMAVIAKAGRAKKGWYEYSAKAIARVFGKDAPRFAALLAALSPQTGVEADLINTLRVWRNWVAAGRPTDQKTILEIMGRSVMGNKGVESVLGAWRNNAYRALVSPDPTNIILSGPKVNSFMLNLLGHMNEVTNDAWMANYTGIDQSLFGRDGSVGLPGKGAGYLAVSIQTRRAARMITWTPAEIQETVWSWAKTLYEKAEALKTTARKLLESGNLKHEDISSTPDFEKLFVSEGYIELFDESIYGEALNQLKADVDKRQAEAPTGSVFEGTEAEKEHMIRAAERLDALAAHRKWLKERTDVLVNLSAATGTIPGLDALQKAANKGDLQARTILQEIARDSLTYLLGGIKSAKVTAVPTTGLYANELEPSLGVTVSVSNAELPKALVALKRFALNFNQKQLHVRQAVPAGTRFGKRFDDGSFATQVLKFYLNKPMPRADIELLAKNSGLVGFTVGEQSLEVYYVGDPKNAVERKKFSDATSKALAGLRAAKLLDRGAGDGAVRAGFTQSVQRLWAYGTGFGATAGYDAIDGQFRAPKSATPASRAAQRVATRLAGREVTGSPQAAAITEEQAAKQRRIAEAFDKLLLDNLINPNVFRAYDELRAEVIEQYDALPIKVEVFADVHDVPAGTTPKQLAALAKQQGLAYKQTSAGIELSQPSYTDETKDQVLRDFRKKVRKLLKDVEAVEATGTPMPAGATARIWVFDRKGEPYKGEKMSELMRKDVLGNNHLLVYATIPDQFGPPGYVYNNHPLLVESGRVDSTGRPMLVNDLLRAVHDYYAHTITPVSFGPLGEEAAWRNHMEMTRSPWARWALTTETRGQNSWVNFRKDVEGKSLRERGFSDQKVDLLPLEFVTIGNPEVDRALLSLPGSDALNIEPPLEPPKGPGGVRELNAAQLDPYGRPMDMVVTHTTRLSRLNGIVELGGMPMPSLAITRMGSTLPTDFGNVVFVGTADMAEEGPVYDYDAYTPTMPEAVIAYDIDEAKVAEVKKDVTSWRKTIEDAGFVFASDADFESLVDEVVDLFRNVASSKQAQELSPQDVKSSLQSSALFQLYFMIKTGNKKYLDKHISKKSLFGKRTIDTSPEIDSAIYEATREYIREPKPAFVDPSQSFSSAMFSWASNAIGQPKRMLAINKVDENGDIRQEFLDWNLTNIVKAMLSAQDERARFQLSDDVYNLSRARASLTRKIRGLSKIQQARETLRSSGPFVQEDELKISKFRRFISDAMDFFTNRNLDFFADSGRWLQMLQAAEDASIDLSSLDAESLRQFVTQELTNLIPQEAQSLEKFSSDMARFGDQFDVADLVDNVGKLLVQLQQSVRTDLVPLFEGKPPRPVMLSEFVGVAVPYNLYNLKGDVDYHVLPLLENNGLQVVRYGVDKEGKELTREQAVRLIAESANRKKQVLFASGEGEGFRAKIDLDTFKITMDPNATVEAWFHELVHGYQQMLFTMVREPNAPLWAKKKATAILDMFKVGTSEQSLEERMIIWDRMPPEQQVPLWEQLAYQSEQYIQTGTAPTVELEGVFQSIRTFVRNVYRNISDRINQTYRRLFKRDLPGLTPEVRAFFDSMLATEEQIKQSQWVRDMVPLFELGDKTLTPEQMAEYLELDRKATEEAMTEMDKIRMRELQMLRTAPGRALAEINKEARRVREQVRKSVAAEMVLQPLYRALHYMRTGELISEDGRRQPPVDGTKLDLEAVKNILQFKPDLRGTMNSLRGITRRGGMDPDVVAELFGFPDGATMLEAITTMPSLEEAIELETDERVKRDHGELFSPEQIEQAVIKVLNNRTRTQFIAAELRWLDTARRNAKEYVDAAREAARQILARKKVRDISPHRFRQLEAEARRDAQEAWKKGDAQRAIAAKRRELLHHEMAKQAVEIREELDRSLRQFRKLNKPDKKLAKTRNTLLVGMGRALLSVYGIGRSVKGPFEFLTELQFYDPDMARELTPLAERARKPMDYRDLSYEDFVGLKQAVEMLWNRSLRDNQIRVEGKLAERKVAVEALTARLVEIGVAAPGTMPGEKAALTELQKAVRSLSAGRALLRRIGAWARAMDGTGFGGAFTKYIYRPVREAWDNYKAAKAYWLGKFRNIIKSVDLNRAGKISADPQSEFDYTFGNGNHGYGVAEILGAMLHAGNVGNLRKNLMSRGWATVDEKGQVDYSRWWTFVQRMVDEGIITEQHLDAVQQVWDLCEELKPQIKRTFYELNGYQMNEVPAQEFTVMLPDGRTKTYRGGYYPARADKWLVPDQDKFDQLDILNGDSRQQVAKGNDGFVNDRTAITRPLDMDLRLLMKHIDDVVRFIHLQPVIKDVAGIVKDPAFRAVAERRDPLMVTNLLMPWLVGTAHARTQSPGLNRMMDQFWNTVKRRVVATKLAYSVRNILQQLTGWFPVLVALNPQMKLPEGVTFNQSALAQLKKLAVNVSYLKSAANLWTRDIRGQHKFIVDSSKYMRDRSLKSARDSADEINDLVRYPNKYQQVGSFLEKNALIGQELFQSMVDDVTWLAIYNATMDNLPEDMSEADAHKECVWQADEAVRLTQGSLEAVDLPDLNRRLTPFTSTFALMYNYFNTIGNFQLSEYVKTIREMGFRGAAPQLVFIYLMAQFLPNLIGDGISRLLGGRFDDEDGDGYWDEIWSWFWGSTVSGTTALVPAVGPTVNAFINRANDKPYDDRVLNSPAISTLEQVSEGTVGIAKKLLTGKEITGRDFHNAFTVAQMATGYPVAPVGKSLGYGYDVARGEVEPYNVADYIRGLITGTASEGTK